MKPRSIYRLSIADVRDLLIVTILITISGFITFFWLIKDTSPLSADEAYYIFVSIRYYDILTHPSLAMFYEFIHVNEFRPPLRMLLTLPFYAGGGISRNVAIGTNMIFLTILLFSTYLLCRKLFNREIALLAVLITSTMPMLFNLNYNYLPDLPAAAMTTLSIYLLIKTELFRNRRYSYLFGIAIAMTILVKLECLMFLTFPLLYLLFKSDLLRLRAFARFLIQHPLHFLLMLISGMIIGGYLYTFAQLVIWIGNDKFGPALLAIFSIIGIVVAFSCWLIVSITLATAGKYSKHSVLERDSLSYLSTLVLAVYLIQYSHMIEHLFPLTLLGFLSCFVISKLYLLRAPITTGFRNWRRYRYRSEQWLNFMRASVMAMVFTLWWYIPSGRRVLPQTLYNPLLPKASEGGHQNLLGWESVSYYFIGLLNRQIFIYFWFLLIAVVLIFWYHRNTFKKFLNRNTIKRLVPTLKQRDPKNVLILVLWVVIPYILLSMSHVKNDRYVAPYLPALAIIIAYGLWIPKAWWKKALVIALVIVVGGSQLYLFSFGNTELPDHVTVDTPLGELQLFGQLPLGRYQYRVHPNDANWRIEEILTDIYQDSRADRLGSNDADRTINIGTITGSYNMHWENLRLYSAFLDYPFEFYTGTSYYEQERFYRSYPKFEYMAILNSTLDENSEWVKNYLGYHETDGFIRNDFILLQDYQLPDGNILEVYERAHASENYSPPEDLPSLA